MKFFLNIKKKSGGSEKCQVWNGRSVIVPLRNLIAAVRILSGVAKPNYQDCVYTVYQGGDTANFVHGDLLYTARLLSLWYLYHSMHTVVQEKTPLKPIST